MARREIPRELSIYINDKQVVNSFAGISRAISQTRSEMNNLNRNSATYNEDMARLRANLASLTEVQAEFRAEINGTNDSFGKLAESFKKLRDGFLSGDLTSIKEGFSELRSGITDLLSTPLGIGLAISAGLAAGAKALFDFNKELEKSNDILRSFGISSAEELTAVRSEVQATADTFEKEFEDIASKANSLSKSYGISMSEANDIIAKGLANGGSQNEEFLDSIGEYDVFFAQAGYSAKEFIDVINRGFDLGIYSDKLPDALKEADLSLKEQTTASRDALVNAFGASFTDDVLARVTAGKTTTKEALEEIAAEAKKTGLSQQQQAQLTADIFRGAGEDAGGALKILEAVGATVQTEMSAGTKAQLELLDANERLNKAQAELFEIEGFGGMWDAIKAQATSALADIVTYISEVKKDLEPLIDLVGFVFVNAWRLLVYAFKPVFEGIKLGIKGVSLFIDDIGKKFNLLRDILITGLQKIVSMTSPILKALGVDVDDLQKKLEALKSKDIVVKTKTTEETTKKSKTAEELAEEQRLLAEALAKQKALRDAAREKEAAARKKELDKKRAEQEKAAKEELAILLALASAKANLAKAELNFFIANNKSKIDDTKKLTPEIIAEETSRLDRILDRQLTALANERLAKVESAEREAKSNEELAILKYTIDLEYETERQNLQLEFQQTTDALKKEYEEEQKVLKSEQLAADNELALIEAESLYEAEKIKQEQDYQEQLARYKKLYDDKKITEAEYSRFKEAAARQQQILDDQRQLQQVNTALGGLNTLASALGEMFGQSKELAIVQANISGAQAVLSIWSAPAALPQPYDAILKGVLTAATVLQTASQIKTITKQKAPKKPKFFYGGFTGSDAIGYDQYGKIVGDVHDNEYVIPKAMTQSPRYANTIAWLEAERTGKTPRKFADGGPTSSNMIPETVIAENDAEMKDLLRALLFRLDNPVAPNLYVGYEQAQAIQDLNDERSASDKNGTVNE